MCGFAQCFGFTIHFIDFDTVIINTQIRKTVRNIQCVTAGREIARIGIHNNFKVADNVLRINNFFLVHHRFRKVALIILITGLNSITGYIIHISGIPEGIFSAVLRSQFFQLVKIFCNHVITERVFSVIVTLRSCRINRLFGNMEYHAAGVLVKGDLRLVWVLHLTIVAEHVLEIARLTIGAGTGILGSCQNTEQASVKFVLNIKSIRISA